MNIKSLISDVILMKYVKDSELFDPVWYSKMYGVKPSLAAMHYTLKGWRNMFDPSNSFSTELYLENHLDVAEANRCPLIHYEKFGRAEGRELSFKIDINKYKLEHGSISKVSPFSIFNKRLSKEKLLEEALKYDIVSFDVFDTLILRNVNRPEDVFRIVGLSQGDVGFQRRRVIAELNAYSTKGVFSNIKDIYGELQKYMSVNSEAFIKKEFDVEMNVCAANPYMQYVYSELISRGKTVIITSDMYWPQDYIEKLLKSCGYSKWEHLYVSCDEKARKGDGSLQKKIKQEYKDKTIFHIGDNYLSDVKQCELNGWNAYHYKSCRDIMPSFDGFHKPNSLTASITDAVIANTIASGAKAYSREYEHGFVFGGLLTTGFCDYINRTVKRKHIDQIWFLARDMEIVNKVFQKQYGDVSCKYVSVSRAAALPLNIEADHYTFFKTYFNNHVNKKNYSIRLALAESRLSVLEPYIANEFSLDEMITPENIDSLYSIYLEHIDEVIAYFKPAVEGAKEYYESILGDKKKILIVDLGWNGTIMIEMMKFFNTIQLPIESMDFLLMASTDGTEPCDLVSSGMLDTYLWSNVDGESSRINTATLRGNTEIMCFEALFSSSSPSLSSYWSKDNKCEMIFGQNTAMKESLIQIQQGILDFCDEYYKIKKKIGVDCIIYPEEAYRYYRIIADDFDYMFELFKDVEEIEDGSTSSGSLDRLTTLGKIMKKRKLVH